MKEYPVWTPILDQALLEMQEVPLLSFPPSFQMEELENHLKKTFQLSDLSIKTNNLQWRSSDTLYHAMGENPTTIAFQISPLAGNIFWILPQKDMHTVTSWLLTKNTIKDDTFFSTPLEEGFYRYILLNVLQTLESMQFFNQFSIQFADHELSEEDKVFCMDIQMQHQDQSCWGRLCLSSSFKIAWQNHFSKTISIHQLFDANYPISLSAIIAQIPLTIEEVKSLETGDIILCKDTSYEIATEKGVISLALNDHILFYAKRKNKQLKIIDFGTYQKEEFMEKPTSPEQPKEMAEETPPVEENLTPINEVPTQLTVEIARVKMPLKKLLELKPGNVLEIGKEINQNVQLTMGGEIVATGELVQLQQALGVRIIHLKK